MNAIVCNVLPQFRAAGFNDSACMALLQELLPGAGKRNGDTMREIVFDNREGLTACVRLNKKKK